MHIYEYGKNVPRVAQTIPHRGAVGGWKPSRVKGVKCGRVALRRKCRTGLPVTAKARWGESPIKVEPRGRVFEYKDGPFFYEVDMGKIKDDLNAAMAKDPAARSKLEVFFTYGGFRALFRHRRAHWFYKHGFKRLAQIISARTRKLTGVDIHPAAEIEGGVFIDHGVGVVIGETAVVGRDVLIYQGVTLGGTGKDTGKRHPTIEEGVMLSAGAKVLGPITVGAHSKVGAGSVVLKDVPPHCTVVGVPGRIVKQKDKRVDEQTIQQLPDPVQEEIKRLRERLDRLEGRAASAAKRQADEE